jgi:hypothetical protein
MTGRGSGSQHLAYLRSNLSIDRVGRKIDHRTVSADIKDGIVVLDSDITQLLRTLELEFDGFVTQEFDTVFIVFEALCDDSSSSESCIRRTHFNTVRVKRRVWTRRRSKVDDVVRGKNVIRVCCLGQVKTLPEGSSMP